MTGRRIGRLRQDRAGNVTILFAGALTMLIGTTALAVDAANLFLEKRRLQGIADAAALAAASDIARADAAALAAVGVNRPAGVTLNEVATGGYAADPAIDRKNRFTVGTDARDAARVTLQSEAPLFFARVFTGRRTVPIAAKATAARINLAAFSIGSRLAAVSGGLPNALLSGLAGTDLQLSALDYQSLVSTHIDVLRFAEALRGRVDGDVATFGETLAARTTLPKVVQAMAAAVPDRTVATILNRLSGRLQARTLSLTPLIDLGPLGSEVRGDPTKPVDVDAYSMLRALLEIGGESREVLTDLGLNLPGLATSRLRLEIGERANHSPWLSVSASRQVTVRTAQMRLYLDTRLLSAAPLGIGAVRLPLFVELAGASATLDSVSCARGRGSATAVLAVTPSAGEVAIADVDVRGFDDFTRPPTLRPATIASALVVAVTGFADIKLGGTGAQLVSFSADDVANHRMKTISTDDMARGVASSLLAHTDLEARVLGLGISANAATAAVGAILMAASGSLDTLINEVTALAGIRVGQADVWVDGIRCGTPILVE